MIIGRVFSVKIKGNAYKVTVGDISRSPVVVDVDGEKFEVEFESQGVKKATLLSSPDPRPAAAATPAQSSGAEVNAAAPANAMHQAGRTIAAPMPGKVLKIEVKPGDSLAKGGLVCTMESMKMEQQIRSNRDGVVEAVLVQAGQNIPHGGAIIRLKDQ